MRLPFELACAGTTIASASAAQSTACNFIDPPLYVANFGLEYRLCRRPCVLLCHPPPYRDQTLVAMPRTLQLDAERRLFGHKER